MHVLIVSPLFPEPVMSGGATRLYNLILQAGRRHALRMISLATLDQSGCTGELAGLAEPATLVPGRVNYTLKEQLTDALAPAQWPRTIRRCAERLRGIPRGVSRVYFPSFENRLKQTLLAHPFEIVQIEFTEMGRYLPIIRKYAPRARVVLEEIDIVYVALQRMIENAPRAQRVALQSEVHRMIAFERRLWRQCDAVITMSDVDRSHILDFIPDAARVWSVPNGVDPGHFSFQPLPETGSRVLFLGYFKHPPNVTGLRFFLNEVWPEVRRRMPEARLDVVGAQPPPDIARLDGADGVVIHGYVPDVRTVMRGCRAMVVPILHGSGTRLKVLEAFSAGLPVISTRIGCEGIRVRDREHLLLADSATEMTENLLVLLRDHALARHVAARARDLVEREYAWGPIAGRLEEVWSHVLDR